MHGEWNRGFGSLLLKIPLMGMRKKSHRFLRSMLERGVSLNFIFFIIIPRSEERWGVAFGFLFSLEVGVGGGGTTWTWWLSLQAFPEYLFD